jgi:pimeloyl-ACP methyl ester carboxylesterase
MVDYEVHIKGTYKLVIAFAGGPQNVFQFRNTLRDSGLSYILMRDSTQRYHHYGVAGLGNQQDVVADIRYLRSRQTPFSAYQYIVTIGVSSGAYAALLYGQLAPVDEVVVISALTGRTKAEWPPEDWPHIVDPANPDVELLPLFKDGPIPKVRAFISDGDGTRLDRRMIERLGVKDVTVIPGFSHADLAKGMRDKGMLKELFLR